MMFQFPGNAKTLTVDGSESHTVLPNLTPGVTYEVTIVAVKAQRESEPGSDSVTTGSFHHNTKTLKVTSLFTLAEFENVCYTAELSSGAVMQQLGTM